MAGLADLIRAQLFTPPTSTGGEGFEPGPGVAGLSPFEMNLFQSVGSPAALALASDPTMDQIQKMQAIKRLGGGGDMMSLIQALIDAENMGGGPQLDARGQDPRLYDELQRQ